MPSLAVVFNTYFQRGDIEDHDLGRWYLKYAADRGHDEARDVLNALDERRNLKLAFGILNLLGYASNIIDERAHRYHKGGRIPGVDRNLYVSWSKALTIFNASKIS